MIRLIHGYDVIDFDILWAILNQDLPALLGAPRRDREGGLKTLFPDLPRSCLLDSGDALLIASMNCRNSTVTTCRISIRGRESRCRMMV